jgi:hypothetical protein
MANMMINKMHCYEPKTIDHEGKKILQEVDHMQQIHLTWECMQQQNRAVKLHQIGRKSTAKHRSDK